MYISKLDIHLHSWQKKGVEWLIKTEQNYGGGLLCDQMGLGKTLEILSLVVLKPVEKTLIIVPTIIMRQWIDWIQKIDPNFYHYHKKPINDQEWDSVLINLQKGIVITSYHSILASRSKKSTLKARRQECSPVHDVYWDRIIIDECHYLQSSKSQRTHAVLGLKGHYRWGLTGTPFEKNTSQMHSILTFLKVVHSDPHKNKISYSQGKSELQHILLARKLTDIPEIKEKMATLIEHNQTIDFTRDEANFYYSLRGDIRREWLAQKNLRLPGWILARNYLLLHSILQLATLHPGLVFEKFGQRIRNGEYRDEWEGEDISLHLQQRWPHDDSSKLNALNNILRWKKDGVGRHERRSLIFLPYKLHLDYLQQWLKKKGYTVALLDGRLNARQKQNLLDRIHVTPYYMESLLHKATTLPYLPPELWRMIGQWADLPQVLLVQNKVGSVGLNLQCFTQVCYPIPMSSTTLESQSIARSYRLGQKNRVDVFRFMMTGSEKHDKVVDVNGHEFIPETIDERMFSLQVSKKENIDKWFQN